MTKTEEILQFKNEATEMRAEYKELDAAAKDAETVIANAWMVFIEELLNKFECIRDGSVNGGTRLDVVASDYRIEFKPRFSDGSGRAALRVKKGADVLYSGEEAYTGKVRVNGRWCPESPVSFPAAVTRELADVAYFILNKQEIFDAVDRELYQYAKSDVEAAAKKLAEKRQKTAFLIGAAKQIADAAEK